MSQPSDRLRQARIRKGFDQAIDASSAYGWNRNTYASNENGNAPFSFKSAQKYAAAFGVRAEWLYSGTGPMSEEDYPPSVLDDREAVTTVPILGEVPAGNWREAVRDYRGWTHIAAREARDGMYALVVSGDSMNRIVEDGALIIVDPNDRDVFHKRLFVVRDAEGEVTFKRYMDAPGRLEPCSRNPDHKTIPITDRNYEIVGRVRKIILDPDQAAID